MRITPLMKGLQTAAVHDLINVVLIFIAWHQMMLFDRFADDFSHRKPWRKGGKGILENNLHLDPQLIQLILRNVVNLFPVKQNLSCRFFPVQTKNRSTGRCLSAAGLSHESHGRSPLDMKGDPVNRLDLCDHIIDKTSLNREILL